MLDEVGQLRKIRAGDHRCGFALDAALEYRQPGEERALLALIVAVAGLAVMVVRRGPAAPPQVQTPSVVPALVSRPIAYPALPDTKALVARNRIFAGEVLASAFDNFGASAAAFGWSDEVTLWAGPR